ncbi:hypothetical protein MBCUT_08100 [Methanobrevibacter cuticularis]|uniref:DUF63 family protein n=1 Tax=Methanobrevibacter cuticularis TaxID=47311 RepID=A0A166ECM1_9EURY|nr:DUF63 family protein [Methanobrevibacter cuticularis]KZX16508.1 hypothetical protein MBCUT_08100 [Methanobrevibacter cuticularis]
MTIEIAILDFFQKYFFSGYTLFNTLFYGIILIIAIFGIIKIFEHYNINPTDLIFPLIPFIFLGSGVRALVDNGIYPYNWFLITPGIYFIVGALAIISLLFGVFLQNRKNIDYRYTIFFIGLFLAIPNLINIHSLNLIAIAQVLIVWSFLSGIFIIIGKFWSLFKNKINLAILSAHIFDASTTFMAVDFYGYWEQHVLPNSIYDLSGTAITMFPLKILVITLSLYLIDKYIEDEILSGTLKLAIFILGLAPGVRNFLTLAIGVS